MIRRSRLLPLLLILVLAPVLSVHAGNREFGARAGFGSNPDQFVGGLQAVFGRYLKVFRFAPSFDLGFGDDMTTYTANGDFRFSVSPPGAGTSFYIATGPTVTHFDYTSGNDTEVGLSVVGGLMLPLGRSNRYNVEFRAGIGDIPDYRLLLGIFFGGGNNPPTDNNPTVD